MHKTIVLIQRETIGLLKIRTSIDIFSTEKCKVTFGRSNTNRAIQPPKMIRGIVVFM